MPVSYTDVVGDWYAEIGNYLWPATATGAVNNGSVVGHFTQVVWKGTTKVGCGYNTACQNVFASDGLTNNAVCVHVFSRSAFHHTVPQTFTGRSPRTP